MVTITVMIDIHCHILPFVDDGPQNLNECLALANDAVRSGITHLFASPHHLKGQYINCKRDILHDVIHLNQQLELEKIPLKVHPGQELMIHREMLFSLKMDEVMTLDNKGKFLLLELPAYQVPVFTHEMVYELLLKGITPIIVHPERNMGFMANHNLLYELVQEGALTQITSGSVIGKFGKKIRTFSEKIIEHNLAHFVASDAHNIGNRGFFLREAYDAITKKFGVNRTFYFRENAELLLGGQHLYIDKPIPIRKKILGIF